mmetsp:Transcript_29808/g.33244  ORF Transcript_29808/g.33244 Transcript_29808/m.33244 type:complete len:219 (-) Transcript_29808:436-1092(-)
MPDAFLRDEQIWIDDTSSIRFTYCPVWESIFVIYFGPVHNQDHITLFSVPDNCTISSDGLNVMMINDDEIGGCSIGCSVASSNIASGFFDFENDDCNKHNLLARILPTVIIIVALIALITCIIVSCCVKSIRRRIFSYEDDKQPDSDKDSEDPPVSEYSESEDEPTPAVSLNPLQIALASELKEKTKTIELGTMKDAEKSVESKDEENTSVETVSQTL